MRRRLPTPPLPHARLPARPFARAARLPALVCLAALLLAPAGSARAEDVPDELRASPAPVTAKSLELSRAFIEATQRVRPAVVKIVSLQRGWSGRMVQDKTGSGFIISPQGHVLTNRHVVLGADQLMIQLADGRNFERLRVLGADPRSDVAILRIEGPFETPLPVAPLGDSDQLAVGEWVLAIGAPFQLESSVSAGVVSATGRTRVLGLVGTSEEFIQTDAALNPGNSGGPLVNLDGQVVGINTAIRSGSERAVANAGVGFAVPVNLARTVAISLIERGVAKRGWLGIHPVALDREALEKLSIEAQGALAIGFVEPGSPAEKAGLKVNELITKIDDRPLRDPLILQGRLAQAGPGGKVKLQVLGDGGEREVEVVLGEEPIYAYGIEVETLDAAKAVTLGLPADATGVVVTSILDGSPAARADTRNRLMPGDVIIEVQWRTGRRPIGDKTEWEQVMSLFQTAEPEVIRFVIRTREGLFQVLIGTRGR